MIVKSFKQWTFLLIAMLLVFNVFAKDLGLSSAITIADLPKEARDTLMLIKQGGPFPYAKDGAIFGNYEGVLPKQKRGYYHEYTVKTPRSRNRGARRIIAGGEPASSQEYYYTENHYATFQRIKQ